jgi:predicted AlkP superfamily pyrophosphatase or phosphodiesterase
MNRPLLLVPLFSLLTLTMAPGAEGDDAAGPDAVIGDGAAPSASTAKPVAAVEHVIIISADGLRPDVLLRARTPNVRGLIESGTFTLWARTVPQSITLPSHTSMLTGVTPERHRVLWNSDIPEPVYPKVPTIFEVAKNAGLTTAMVTGKSKFVSLARPGSVDWEKVQAATDEEVGSHAASILRDHKPNLLVVHFPGADAAGHSKGWGSPEQIEAVEKIDRSIGVLLDTVAEQKLAGSTVVIMSADHGGAGRSHGPNDPRSRHIPWIVSGPGIRKGYDLTRDPTLTVNTEDTFATACWFLGLRPPGKIDGKPIEQVLGDRELLRNAK